MQDKLGFLLVFSWIFVYLNLQHNNKIVGCAVNKI